MSSQAFDLLRPAEGFEPDHTRNDPFGRLHGFRGVWLFFVLSGFLITTLALREEDRTGALDVRRLAGAD